MNGSMKISTYDTFFDVEMEASMRYVNINKIKLFPLQIDCPLIASQKYIHVQQKELFY
jgi:hypothetical protein